MYGAARGRTLDVTGHSSFVSRDILPPWNFSEDLDAIKASEQAQARQAASTDLEEQRQARALLSDFVKTVREKGIPPQRAKTHSTTRSYRTSLYGWSFRRGYCVGTDGEMYSLIVEGGLFRDKRPRRLTTLPTRFNYRDDYNTLQNELLQFLRVNTKR